MKMIYFLSALFVAAPLLGETLNNLEYQLPAVAKDWQQNKTESKENKSISVFYVPKEGSEATKGPFFAVSLLDMPTGVTDPEAFQKLLELQFDDKAVHVKSVEKDEHSTLLEWWVNDGDKELIHGWARIISFDDRTATLTFTTRETSDIEKTRSIWLPVLQNAKIVK